jgi:putative hydrolase of the HAD superfamily
VRAVLLDALGTLLELRPPWPALALALDEQRGVQITTTEAERAFRAEMAYYRAHHHEGREASSLLELRRACADVLHAALPAAAADSLSAAELLPLMLEALRFAPYPEVPEVLRALRDRGLRLVAASNWDVSLHEVLSDTGLAELLDGAVASAEVAAAKPSPEVFRAALELAGVAAEDALHVGDSPEYDIPGALAAGIAPVLLARAGDVEQLRATLQVPVISSLAQLPGLLG